MHTKILFVTSKHPFPSDSRDGGDSTVSEMIQALGNHCQMDILCFREFDGCSEIPSVHEIFFQNIDFANYKLYSGKKGEKFLIRLQQAEISAKKIANLAPNYDVIIVQHCMFLLKLLEIAANVFEKIILFPMFTAMEYMMTKDFVPSEYVVAEKEALLHVPKFITPSNAERDVLINGYNVPSEKIFVIPRSVNEIKFTNHESCRENLQLIYIASIRRQKAHKDALELFRRVKKSVPLAQMHCVGTIQDEDLFRGCMDFLSKYALKRDVIFHGTLNHMDMNRLLSSCDINISVSLWETFGRGIFEGMAAGLPTVVLQRIRSISDFPEDVHPIIVSCLEEMKDKILMLYKDAEFFNAESSKGKLVGEYLSFKKIQVSLRNIILFD